MGPIQTRIYLDHNATTPVAPEVVGAMTGMLAAHPGNPSSTHAEGAEARREIEVARERVGIALGSGDASIVFGAGATEANNTLFAGLLAGGVTGHVVMSEIEHPSVLEPAAALEKAGVRVSRVSVDHDGRLDLDQLVEALEPETRLVSIIMANNETGVVQPIAEIAALIRAGSNARFHTDATQAVGKWPVDFRALDVDYLSFSAHKLNGPKGTGCLVARADAPIEPLLLGGSQEKRRRGGTENVAGIVGLGIACELAQGELESRMKSQAHLRDRLWERFRESIPGAQRNAPLDAVLPNTLNVELPGIAGDVLLQALDLEGVSASAGAACHSGSISPSHVLTAMGRSPEAALASLRFSVGLGNTEHEIDRAADLVIELVARMSGSANHG